MLEQQQQRGELVESVEVGEEKEEGDGEEPSSEVAAPVCDEKRRHMSECTCLLLCIGNIILGRGCTCRPVSCVRVWVTPCLWVTGRDSTWR